MNIASTLQSEHLLVKCRVDSKDPRYWVMLPRDIVWAAIPSRDHRGFVSLVTTEILNPTDDYSTILRKATFEELIGAAANIQLSQITGDAIQVVMDMTQVCAAFRLVPLTLMAANDADDSIVNIPLGIRASEICGIAPVFKNGALIGSNILLRRPLPDTATKKLSIKEEPDVLLARCGLRPEHVFEPASTSGLTYPEVLTKQ